MLPCVIYDVRRDPSLNPVVLLFERRLTPLRFEDFQWRWNIVFDVSLLTIIYKLEQQTLRHCFRLRWASVESRIVFESNSSSAATAGSIHSSKLADRVVCDRDTDGWFVITVVLDDSELESNDFNLWILSRLFHCYKITICKVKIVHQRYIQLFRH